MSRRRQSGWQKHILAHLWLAIPAGVIGAVAVLALLNRPGTSPDVATSPTATISPAPDRTMGGNGEAQGLVEEFIVTDPGEVLPDRPADADLPGQSFPDLGRDHVPDEEPVTYNSNPPTTGPHSAQWARWGIYNQAPPDRQLVHNLEHGGVVISYHPDRIPEGTLEQLRTQVREFSQTNPRVVLTPRDDLEGAIALTAWGYLQSLENYNPDAIEAFYMAHIARGPECSRGQCPG